MRKPAIVFVNRVYPPVGGATGRLLRDLARSFARQGWQVTVVTSGAKAGKEYDGTVKVIRVKGPEKPRGALGYAYMLMKLSMAAMRVKPCDVVVSMTDPPLLGVCIGSIARLRGLKHVHWVQDIYPDLFGVMQVKYPKTIMRVLKWLNHKMLVRADRVVVIGRCMARYLTHDGASTQNMSVIPNWSDFELVKSRHRDETESGDNGDDHAYSLVQGDYSDRIGYYRKPEQQVKSPPKFRVLYAGNIGRLHPIDVIIDAARILQTQAADIEFVFVGAGTRFDAISEVKTREHLDNIRLLPYQPAAKLKALMASGDVHLISMDDDALGLAVPSKIYAAIGAQRPCVFMGPKDSEVSMMIDNYGFGDVVGCDDAQGLVDAVMRYRSDGQAWFNAQQAAQQAADVFTPKASIQAWLERAWALVDVPK